MNRHSLWLGIVWSISLGLMLGGCATYRPADPAFHKVLQAPYRLDSGDRIRVTVFEQAELTNTYLVDKAGYIAFPLVGSVPARGQTIKHIESYIAQHLATNYIRNPDVSAEIARYRPFYIMGEVNSAGQYTYVSGMTVQNAIAAAGGFSSRAQHEDADITRHINGEVITGRVPITDPVMPGDTIYVRERLF